MKRELFAAGIVVVLLIALPISSFGEENNLEEIKSPDGALSLRILDLRDMHGLTYLKGILKNVSDNEFENLNLEIIAHQSAGRQDSVEINFGRVIPGEIRVFEKVFAAPVGLINKIEIAYTVVNEAAY